MKYTNPVIPGCFPDPSICRVGNDYYVVNSTFEFFPGIPVSHSQDLIHWEQIGYCIDRPDQLRLITGRISNTGLFAPTIRHHNGLFYMIVTNVANSEEGTGNFYVWAENPAGPWSDPVFLPTPGIDPSLFFDDDGRAYYTGSSDSGIVLCEVDLQNGKLLDDPAVIWGGTGGAYPEGPHLYKKDGWYYLMISEGGTERGHMLTMARSRCISGPYEACPHNPVMSNRSHRLPIDSVGHADLVCDPDGNWWAICLGTRLFGYPPRHNLGRETMLVPVTWQGEWPVFGDHGLVHQCIETDLLPCTQPQQTTENWTDDFDSESLDLCWNHIYVPQEPLYRTGHHALTLYGNAYTLSDAQPIAWIGRRQRHHGCDCTVTLHFPTCQRGEEAGLSVFMTHRHHYEIALLHEDERKLILRRQIGSLWKIEQSIPYSNDTVTLRLEGDKNIYRFSYALGDQWITLGSGETQYLTTEVGGAFTGNYIALYACGNGIACQTPAAFSHFCYHGEEVED